MRVAPVEAVYHSPIGPLRLFGDGMRLARLWLPGGRDGTRQVPEQHRDDAAFAAVREQLDAYFAGSSLVFDLPLDPVGTPFQHQVWQELRRIPPGVTVSYGELARRIGQPGASRAVGAANGANPLPIVVPCHRVIGADGSLTGFGGGLAAKRWLLAWERGGVLPGFL